MHLLCKISSQIVAFRATTVRGRVVSGRKVSDNRRSRIAEESGERVSEREKVRVRKGIMHR